MQHACQFQLQRAPLLPATHGELAFCTTLLSRHSLPGVKLASLSLPFSRAISGDLAFCATLLTRHSLPEGELAFLFRTEL